MTEVEKAKIVLPGEIIGNTEFNFQPGNGAYLHNNKIYSSLVGEVYIEKLENESKLSVRGLENFNPLPRMGSIVTCKVTHVTQRNCKCIIIAIEDYILKEPFKGIIRKEDIVDVNKDEVEVVNCFRPQDIILARVLSMGEANFYLLTTCDESLGVYIAKSQHGGLMYPISWTEMQCPKTFVKEKRKVAKIIRIVES
ncbi:unnamed protein product [Gordionus sp. m RMFG-2023]|uniref:exosome complex component CSL4-like n=1 Tax=Gordionus sp. m RMFG-2023 TaxID=3053472 RepID=UPI0030E1DA48